MKSTQEGHQQISFLERLIKILYWVMIGCLAVGSLALFIAMAVLIGGGVAAGIFFALLFGNALVAFILYIAKCTWLIKIGYYDDIKYIRDFMHDTTKKIKPENRNENKPSYIPGYYILNNSNSAYVVRMEPKIGPLYIQDFHKAKKFETNVLAKEYASQYNLDTTEEFSIVLR